MTKPHAGDKNTWGGRKGNIEEWRKGRKTQQKWARSEYLLEIVDNWADAGGPRCRESGGEREVVTLAVSRVECRGSSVGVCGGRRGEGKRELNLGRRKGT